MHKINIFVFFILNIISNQFLSGFGLLGGSKRLQKQVVSFEKTDYGLLLSAFIVSSSHFGAPSSLKGVCEAILWKQRCPFRPLEASISQLAMSFRQSALQNCLVPLC